MFPDAAGSRKPGMLRAGISNRLPCAAHRALRWRVSGLPALGAALETKQPAKRYAASQADGFTLLQLAAAGRVNSLLYPQGVTVVKAAVDGQDVGAKRATAELEAAGPTLQVQRPPVALVARTHCTLRAGAAVSPAAAELPKVAVMLA
jgi:hypothetical protein